MQHSPFLGGFLVELSCPLTSCNRFSSSRFFSKASSSFVFPTGFLIARRKGQRIHYIILPLVNQEPPSFFPFLNIKQPTIQCGLSHTPHPFSAALRTGELCQ